MSQHNGSSVILPARPPLDESRQSCIDLLADALDEATKGKIKSVAIVVCMDDGLATVMAGKDGAALNIGCDDLKKKIHAAMFEDGNVGRKRSAIMRAG
jgi:uncharacterized protein YaiI (UPF0178 family)